jgi:nicotinamide-nucleotide amidase
MTPLHAHPTVEIITIGDEILIGQIVDTNSAWMARELNKEGLRIVRISTVPDEQKAILDAIDLAFGRADIVLMTGGLGPTKDDITQQTLCLYFNTELVHNADVEETIRKQFVHRPEVLNELTMRQAYVPASATIVQNKRGTAPVTWFEKDGRVLVSMPGVPSEMEWVMSNEVLPRLMQRFQTPALLHKNVLVVGIPESTLALRLSEWEAALPLSLKLAYLPAPGMVKLRLSGHLNDKSLLEQMVEDECVKLRKILGKAIFAEVDAAPEELVGQWLRKHKRWIATAESCTGGNIARKLTSVPGSSDYFIGSIVAYKNEVKAQQLGVSHENLRLFGAVSREVVEEMAQGVRLHLSADIGVAVSGIAGPDGATEGKPVGTVWIAVCDRKKCLTRRFQFGQHRQRNIEMATLMAFTLIKELLEDE